MAEEANTVQHQDATLGQVALSRDHDRGDNPAKNRRPPRQKVARSSTPKRRVRRRRRQLSDEDIRVRAYFIAEMRARMSIPSDAEADWLEARRQLLAERGEL